ncbi:hypothetical protein VFPPC_15086 [Pochonia chlamydosporia 170]|uniref:Uncharacterized protein n=1 Tax=Pochonia chlamydosporia 170 TaxID=1380566 RepID=A0A179G4H3_METCM|nr:hypothetical protein VFPPC_15086 [Pochonia chlamydosporia 170]OAQ72233.1 hypothetical protein VFPPC_15086 [Pochonia chlamydosporia 170]
MRQSAGALGVDGASHLRTAPRTTSCTLRAKGLRLLLFSVDILPACFDQQVAQFIRVAIWHGGQPQICCSSDTNSLVAMHSTSTSHDCCH